MSHPASLSRVYRGPAIVALLTAAGLALALFGDGLWDAVSWVLLAIPLLMLARFFVRGARLRRN